MRKRLLYYGFLFIITCLLLELALRIYNPFNFTVKANSIVLAANKTYTIYNNSIPVLPPVATHTKNSLGFRGPEKPADLNSYLSIITVGGSTTECFYLHDTATWTFQLQHKLDDNFSKLWLNNAGLSGHSTFGHKLLLRDYIVQLKPTVILFLVGINDVARTDLTDSDKSTIKSAYKNIGSFLSQNSELCNVILNLMRSRKAAINQLHDSYINLAATRNNTLLLAQPFIDSVLQKETVLLPAYQQRLLNLINTCRQNNILPVFITQPSLFGSGTDPVTDVNLETYRLEDGRNGNLFWQRLEMYNKVTRTVCSTQKIHCIDLANSLPKSSNLFYDRVHFTNEGAKAVAQIVHQNLFQYLAAQFPQHVKQ
ncbi:MAG: hypothetical protein EAZ16_05945 [Sphingobacteriales bacterium]|nr:MAG: hypothetical protein EAZ16_05945 [Sphingobacteriales bacterium]